MPFGLLSLFQRRRLDGLSVAGGSLYVQLGSRLQAAVLQAVPRTVTRHYELDLEAGLILVDASSGPIDIQLPPSRGVLGYTWTVKKVDETTNLVNLVPFGTELIDGKDAAAAALDEATSWRIPYASRTLVPADDGRWWIL